MYQFLVISHVLFGSLSLAIGLVAMRSKKGGKVHLNSGRIYYYSMIYVCISAIIIQFFNFRPFLALISIFSLYFVLMGKWALRYKNRSLLPRIYEQTTIILFTLTGFVMIVYAIFINNMSIILLIFGLAALFQGVVDLKNYSKKDKVKNWWLLEHIGKIGTSYIATVTAFLVNNSVHWSIDVPNIIIWIGPGVIGGFIIARVSKKYEVKQKIQQSRIS